MNLGNPQRTSFGLAAWLALVVVGLWYPAPARGQIPHLLNYHGYLTTPGTGTPVNATVSMVLKLYDVASGGPALYSETQSVTVTNSVFNVVIGAVTPLTLPFDAQYYLGVTADADPEMTPRQLVTASPYALRAASANALAPAATAGSSQVTGTIGTPQIANNAVTLAKLSPLTGAAAGKVLGTDGSTLQWLMLLHAMFGLSGTSITNGAVGAGASRTTWVQIQPLIHANALDVDGNGVTDALTDGLIIIRALRGLTGTAVTDGALGASASRGGWSSIRSYLNAQCGTTLAP